MRGQIYYFLVKLDATSMQKKKKNAVVVSMFIL